MDRNSKKTYTILLFSDSAEMPKKVVVPGAVAKCGVIALGVLIVLGSSVFVDYVQLLFEKNQTRWLRTENLYLKEQFKDVEGKLVALETSLERVESFSKKLKLITNIGSADRELELTLPMRPDAAPDGQSATQPTAQAAPQQRWPASIGPIEGYFEKESYNSPVQNSGDSVAIQSNYSTISVRMDKVLRGTELREKEALQLWKDLSDKNDILLTTPSIRPTGGWISSTFGTRSSPFSGDLSQHKGLDIAADSGTPIVAPASGIVSYASFDEGYGKLISIDHGHGIVTRFGHCSQMYVKVGQQVRRGDIIGAVGTTGRSTGPHLHYEVRLGGVPVNPEKFILE
jgi:murein DD-endopeptidase MepM/ murein hydrolase activator NlpD